MISLLRKFARALLIVAQAPLTRRLLAQLQRPFALTLSTNANAHTLQLHELRSRALGSAPSNRLLEPAWPRNVFSLSHVALPFPPDDPMYGYVAPVTSRHVQLGRIERFFAAAA